MNEVEKPRRKAGQAMCPMFRKDCAEVCHLCDWYRPLPLEIVHEGRTYDDWGCTMTHLLKVSRDLVSQTDGVQQAVESFRNDTYTANRLSLTLQAREGLAILEADKAASLPPPEPKTINGKAD